jgi:integrase
MEKESCARTAGQWATLAARRWPPLARCPEAFEWVRVQADLGLAPRTLEAYARGLADYLAVCVREEIDPLNASRAEVARYVRDLVQRPSPRGATIISIDAGVGLANATLQQRLVVVRLFYDYLIEEGRRDTNPVGRGRYTPGRGSVATGIAAWCRASPSCPGSPRTPSGNRSSPRTRLMLALAYDAGLRREELCSLRTDDLDPAYRTVRVRAETTKNRRARVVPYSAPTGTLLQAYLTHRREARRAGCSSSRSRGATGRGRSRPGPGPRSFGRSPSGRRWAASARTRHATCALPTSHGPGGSYTRSLASPATAIRRPRSSTSTCPDVISRPSSGEAWNTFTRGGGRRWPNSWEVKHERRHRPGAHC